MGQKRRKDFEEVVLKEGVKSNSSGFWLDGYSDLFSDFDHRSYLQRALSYDFLSELKRATKEIDSRVKLKLYLPEKRRNRMNEQLIEHRLTAHFSRHYELLLNEKRSIIKFGLFFAVLGIILMFGAAYLLYSGDKSLLLSFAVILLEPAGWFLFWDGLEQIIFESKKINPELEFYKKMSKGSIYFYSC